MSDFPDWYDETGHEVAEPVSIAIEPDIAHWFFQQGREPGLESRVNRLLREYMNVNRQNPSPDL